MINNFYLQASASPMISPRSSPRFVRRSVTPTVGVSPTPPPLPPRKSSPTLEQNSNNLSLLHQNISVRNGNKHYDSTLNEAQSVVDLSQRNNELPQISKSSSMNEIFTTDTNQSKQHVLELSSPETIYGIIDSRYNFCNIDTKSQSQKFQDAVSSNSGLCPIKSSTVPNITSQTDQEQLCYISKEPPYENIRIDLPPKNKPNPLIAKGNGSVSYENLNMDYIKKLVSEGYSKDAVIRALGITRNNIDMACDILHEFGTKHG